VTPVRALLACVAALLLLPASASAHAQLIGSTPERGATVETSPAQVEMRFNEAVEISFGSVRVLDAEGNEVQTGTAEHPGGRSKEVAQPIQGSLPDGTYTVTFRVVSADSHPITGGFVFSVGEGGPAPQTSVAELLDQSQAGPATEIAFGIVRALAYLAMALAVGVIAYALLVWTRSLRVIARAGDDWLAASKAFAERGERLFAIAVVIGIVSTVLGIVLQGATAAGTTFWSALDPDVLRDVLSTRFGTVWGIKLLVWLGIGALLVVPGLRVQVPRLRPASLGATGLVLGRGAPPVSSVLLAAFIGYILLTPALAGHATTQEPVAVLLPTDLVHVIAMCIWIGGLVVLVTALPAATRALAKTDRSRLLASNLHRFSPLALACVIALVASGVIQSIVHLSAWSQLWETPFGRAVLIKIGLLVILIGLGAYNKQRSIPRLKQLAREERPPGNAGMLLRRALRAEVALVVAVIAVTAALVSYPPPISVASGPFSANTELGPSRMELTVDPAKAGANEIHLYLFDSRTGAQYDEVKEFTITASLPDQQIGPLPIEAVKGGPGHYLAPGAQLAPAGDWEFQFRARVSEFEEFNATVVVPVQ
jgi:copper transport protein